MADTREPSPRSQQVYKGGKKEKDKKDKTKTPGQRLEDSGQYLKDPETEDLSKGSLMIQRDPTVQQNLDRDKIKYGPTDALIQQGKLKEAAEQHPDKNKYKLQISQAVKKLVQTGRNALSIGSGLWQTYRALRSLK